MTIRPEPEHNLTGIFVRFLSYTGAGLLASSVVVMAIMLMLPESMRSPVFSLTHSLIGGVVVLLLIRRYTP